MTTPPLLCVCLLLSLSLLCSGSKDVHVEFDEDSYNFEVYIDDVLWFRSGVMGISHQGSWWNSESADTYSLKLKEIKKIERGEDSIGHYEGMMYSWTAYSAEGTPTKTSIKTSVTTYFESPTISFDIEYVSGLSNPTESKDISVVSSFPSFVYNDEKLERGWMTWSGNMASKMRFGQWAEGQSVYSDLDGGFPLVVFDSKMETAVVLSPMNTFMTAHQTSFTSKKTNETMVTFGPLSSIVEVPVGYKYSTLLVAADGVKNAMKLYGEILVKHYKKGDDYRKSDFSINYLGYWTDNGGCYHYYDGQYDNYEDLLLDVKKHADAKEIPFRYLQLDSWWYFKGKGDGVKNWTAMPSVFPNGIQSLQQKTEWPIVAHNRYWSPDTDYASKFKFIVEDKVALPDDYSFWDYLISTAVNDWKMITYEQDWLDTEFRNLDHLQRNLSLGELWLRQMAGAAETYGITIQYCMPWPRHVLQSVMLPAVTQIRVSDDYQPDNEQWKVGDSTILSHFIGLAAFKDDFRTSSNQPDCVKLRNTTEKFPMLEAYSAAMSGGPVGPSDMVGTANATIIKATCMKNGRLLKPTSPIMSLESTFLRRAFDKEGPIGQMVAAYTQVEYLAWYYVMAAELEADYALSFSELPLPSNSISDSSFHAIAFQYNVITGQASTMMEFNENVSITIEKCEKADFKYYAIAPRFFNEMYLFGELNKFVPVSKERFINFDQTMDEVHFSLAGIPTEIVSVTVYDGKTLNTVSCTIRDDYFADLTISSANVTCV